MSVVSLFCTVPFQGPSREGWRLCGRKAVCKTPQPRVMSPWPRVGLCYGGTSTAELWPWQEMACAQLLPWTQASELHSLAGLDSGGPYCVNKGAVVLTAIRTESWCGSLCKVCNKQACRLQAVCLEAWFILSQWEREHMLHSAPSPRAPLEPRSAGEPVLHGVITTFRLLPAPQFWKLGCIDVNSGALEVSKLGTYLKSAVFFFFIEKDFWCFCFLRNWFLKFVFNSLEKCLVWASSTLFFFSFPQSILIYLPKKKRAGLSFYVTYIH